MTPDDPPEAHYYVIIYNNLYNIGQIPESNPVAVSILMFTVYFDSTVFQINSVSENINFISTGGNGPYYESNNVSFWYEYSSLSGDGIVAEIDFDRIGSLEDTDIGFGEIICYSIDQSCRKD